MPLEEHCLSEYDLVDVIGHGSFATVYLGIDKRTKESVAIKAINLDRLNHKLTENLTTEISIMKEIRHENIVQLIGIEKTARNMYIIMEHCGDGDMADLLQREGILEESAVRTIAQQLVSGLEALRLRNIFHRDLKPHNLLLSMDSFHEVQVKIADFGLARLMMPSDLAQTLCGSPLYMAPEILRYEKYNSKADLWSVGAIMYEMLYGHPPYQASNHIQLQKLIETSGPLPYPKSVRCTRDRAGRGPVCYSVSDSCIDLIQSLLKKNPIERISFEEFFSHPYFVGDHQMGTTQRTQSEASTEYEGVGLIDGASKNISVPTGNIGAVGILKSASESKQMLRSNSISTMTMARDIRSATAGFASLGSSMKSIPPFARMSSRFGTPTGQGIESFIGDLGVSSGSTAAGSMLSSSKTRQPCMANSQIRSFSKDPLIAEGYLLCASLIDACGGIEGDCGDSRSISGSQILRTEDSLQMWRYTVFVLLNFGEAVWTSKGTASAGAIENDRVPLQWFWGRLEYSMEKMRLFKKEVEAIDADETCEEFGPIVLPLGSIYSYALGLVWFGPREEARDGGLQELLGRQEAAHSHYERARVLLEHLSFLLTPEEEEARVIGKCNDRIQLAII